MLDMATSAPARIWVRNPSACVRECIEEGMFNFIWDIGYTVKRSIDPLKFAEVWCGGMPWKFITVSDHEETCVERTSESTRSHDVWCYGEPLRNLEELLSENAGTDRMVIVMRIPNMNYSVSVKFGKMLAEIQDDYPSSIVHPHAQYSFSYMFGYDFKSVDIEPREDARLGNLYLPNGMRRTYLEVGHMMEWVNVLGMTARDLTVPRNRCLYNLRSAKWASMHYKETPNFATAFGPKEPFDRRPARKRRPFFRYIRPEDGDKLACDTCSLAESCRYYRPGAICAVPDSDVADYGEYFNTRDADAIVEGLGELLASQMQRLQMGMEAEEEAENKKLSREVTSLFDKVFKNGVALAKLVDPTLAKPAVQVSISSGAPALPEAMTKQALMAAVVGELEARGIERADITPDMVNALLTERAEQAALARGK